MAEAAAVAATGEGPGRRGCPSGSAQGAGARPWPTGLKADGGAVVVWVVVVMVNEPRKEASGALEGPAWQGGEEGDTGDSLPRREDEDDEASRPLSSPDEEKNEDDEEKNDDEEEKKGEEPTSERG